MLPIIALYGFVFLVAFYGAYASYGDRARLRRAMAAALAEGRDDLELTDGQRPEVRGRLDGREVELRLGRDGAWTARARVENAPPDFTVSPLTNGRRLARWLGLVRDPALGDRRADDRFVLASEDAARTAPLFAKDGLGPRLDRLFGATVSAQRVRLEGGWVEVRFRDDLAAGADPAKRQRERERCLGVLADVAALAGLCERRRISVGKAPPPSCSGGPAAPRPCAAPTATTRSATPVSPRSRATLARPFTTAPASRRLAAARCSAAPAASRARSSGAALEARGVSPRARRTNRASPPVAFAA